MSIISLPRLPATSAFLLLSIASGSAHATLGLFEHGNGIASLGMGGISYSVGQESTVLAGNPALAATLGNRFDIGSDFFYGKGTTHLRGNSLGPDDDFETNGKNYFTIPQGGFTYQLSDRASVGMTMLSAGLVLDYDGSPFERFGGAHRISIYLANTSVVTALAWRLNDDHAFGLSLNTGYQQFGIKGADFLAKPEASVAPDKVTDQGRDGSFTLGFNVGWYGKLTPWMSAGLGYRSKNWTQRHKEYEGLVAEHGRLELPSIYGGGFAFKLREDLTFAIEGQRYTYRKSAAFRNHLGELEAGNLFGSSDGPGFGFKDQNALKFGLAWQSTPTLMLRAGYVHATQILDPSQTLFGTLGCVTTTNQYGVGATYRLQVWELTGYAYNDPEKTLRGKNSIPASFGGGENDIDDKTYGVGFSLGRKF